MRWNFARVYCAGTVCAALAATTVLASERETRPAQVTLRAGRPGCDVEVDGTAVGKTESRGDLTLPEVDPSDHYIHVRCPGEEDRSYFVSLLAGRSLEVRAESRVKPTAESATPVEVKIELRRLVQQSIQLRNQGHFDEAVKGLREAMKMDPVNSDLHRELGITFLLEKEWKRARVEMIEALRRQSDDADAHNGLGYALEKLGDLKAALKEFRTATQLDPDDQSYRQHYIEALVKLSGEQAEPKKGGGQNETTQPHRH